MAPYVTTKFLAQLKNGVTRIKSNIIKHQVENKGTTTKWSSLYFYRKTILLYSFADNFFFLFCLYKSMVLDFCYLPFFDTTFSASFTLLA